MEILVCPFYKVPIRYRIFLRQHFFERRPKTATGKKAGSPLQVLSEFFNADLGVDCCTIRCSKCKCQWRESRVPGGEFYPDAGTYVAGPDGSPQGCPHCHPEFFGVLARVILGVKPKPRRGM